jgi:ribonuclease D
VTDTTDIVPDVEARVAEAVTVTDEAGLAALCERARAAGSVILDTEFERTDTFFPRVALVQFAVDGAVSLVDPLVIRDPAPLRALLEDPDVEKVLHACSEDIEVFNHWTGARPVRIFDTQLAAAFLGGRFGAGYGELVRTELGIEMDKGETRSDWLRRPLTASQHRYACLDVIWLGAVHARQKARLEVTGRLDWLMEETARAVADVLDRPGPESAWAGIKRAGTLAGPGRAALRDLAVWRERTARELDRPRNRVARDEHLLALAETLPERVETLRGDVLPHGMVKRWGETLQAIVDDARNTATAAQPEAPPPPLSRSEGEVLKKLRAEARECAGELGLAEELLARKKLIEPWLTDPDEVPEAWDGWRWPLCGERLIALRDRRAPPRAGGRS